MTTSRRRAIRTALAISLVAGLAALASPACADSVSFNLDVGNPQLGGYSGPYLAVTVNLVSAGTATVSVSSLTQGAYTYLFGGAGTFALNTNGAVNVSNIAFNDTLLSGWSSTDNNGDPSVSVGAPGNEDGLGAYNLVFDNYDGFSHALTSLSFTLTGGNWSSASDVLAANASTYVAAAHVFAASATCGTSSNCGATGYAASSGITPSTGIAPVPEPSTLALLGSGLVGIGVVLRRRFFSTVAS